MLTKCVTVKSIANGKERVLEGNTVSRRRNGVPCRIAETRVSSARRRETVQPPIALPHQPTADRVLTFVGVDFPTWPLDHARPVTAKLLSGGRVYCGRALP